MRTIAKLQKRKSIFKRLADRAKYERVRRFYAQEVWQCDEEIAKIRSLILKLVVAVNIFVIILILAQSCKATAGLGRDITWVGEAGEEMLHYESRKNK